MKKILTVLICTLTITIYGQTNILDLGIEGGISAASLRGNTSIDNYHGTRIGYMGGLFIQYNFRKIISLRTGSYFEEKGSAIKFDLHDQNGQTVGTIHGKENFDYLTIPLLLRATFGKKLNYFINVGPYIGFLIKQTEHTDAFQNYPETNPDRTDITKKTEIGLSTGLGLSYTIRQHYAFSFEVRNNLGLTNTSAVPVLNDGTVKTNALNFLFGFAYKLGQRS